MDPNLSCTILVDLCCQLVIGIINEFDEFWITRNVPCDDDNGSKAA